MVTISTDAENGAQPEQIALPTVVQLRADAARLRALVVQVLHSHITEMTGPFTSMRQVPNFAEQLVAQYLDVLDDRLTPTEIQTQMDFWVARGLGPEGAYAVMDTLYNAGAKYEDAGLALALNEYRRKFSVSYEIGRRTEILGEQERMQRSLYGALQKQLASERELREALVRRQAQLEAAADLARVTGSLRDVNDLLATACRHLKERLALAFVGVYLLDEFRQRAILRAGAGSIGQELMAQGQQLPMVEFSPLSHALHENRLVFLKEGTDAAQPYTSPLLPAAEMAVVVPLNAHDTILGFLTAFSMDADAFTPQDTPVLELIADNLAYAIENAVLFAKSQTSLEELQRTQRSYLREAWTSQQVTKELVYSQTHDDFGMNGHADQLSLSASVNGDTPQNTLSVPIMLRGEVIGTVDLMDVTQQRTWTRDEQQLASGVVEQMALAVENARLFDQSQQRSQELAAINEITNVISEQLEIERLLEQVHQQVQRVMSADAFFVGLYDDVTDMLSYPYVFDDGKRHASPGSRLSPRGSLRQVVDSGKGKLINRTPQEMLEAAGRMNPETAMGDASRVSASLLYAPLRRADRIVGVISAQSYSPNAYQERDLELLDGIGIHVAVALQNARLFEATQKREQETALINEMARELSGELDQDRLFGKVYPYLKRLMPADAFVVWFHDEAAHTATRSVLFDLDVRYPAEVTPQPLSSRLEKVLETNAPLVVNLTRQEWEQERAKSYSIFGSSEASASLLYVPLRVANRIRGFLSVQSYQFNAYDEPQIALLTAVANYLATALENAQLFEATDAALQETQTLYNIGARLNQVTSLEDLVRIAAQRAFEQGAGSAQLLLMDYQDGDQPVSANVVVSLVAPGEPAPFSPYTHFPINRFELGQAMLANPRELVMIDNVAESTVLDEETRRVLLASHDLALVMLPLTVEQRVLGAIAIGWDQPRTFSAQERRIYQALSSELALVLNNRLLFEQTQAALQEARALYEVSTRLNAANNLQEALEAASAKALESGAHLAALFAMNLDANDIPRSMTLQATTGPAVARAIQPGTILELADSPFANAWTQNPSEPVFVDDIETDVRLTDIERFDFKRSRVRSAAVLPLYIAGRWAGMVGLNWSELHNFSDSERRLYRSVMSQAATVLDNRRLFEQTQEALAETQTLYEISARLNASNSIQEALEAAAGPAIVQGAYTASLLRVISDATGAPTQLEFSALWPRHSEVAVPLGTRFASEFLSGDRSWIENPYEPVLIEDVTTDPRVNELGKASYASNAIHATALLPMKIGDRWIGVLNFNWKEPRTFTPRDVRLYRSLMAQASTVLDNRSLFEQTEIALAQTQTALSQVQEAQDRLNLQYQTANILARANSFEQAAPLLLENICRSLNWQMGEYWALDETTNRLVLTNLWNEPTEALGNFAADSNGLTFGPGEGLSGRTWSEGRPIWVPNIAEDAGFQQPGKAAAAGLVSAVAFPLQSEARQFGVTVFFSKYTQAMDDTLMATMVGVGSQIGQYMERRRAEESVRQQNTYLTALHDTTLGLMRRLDLDELLQNIITRAGELVGTEHGYVHLIEPSGTELRMRVGIGIYQDFIGTRVKPGQGLAGTVWQNQEPIIVDDYRYWQGRLPMVDRDVLRAVAGVPLKSGTQTVGVLGLASLVEGRKFGAAQVEALNRFAELAAVALDNAQLYDASQNALEHTLRVAEREKASAEIADKLYAAADIQSVLRTAAEELMRNTKSRRAIVRLNLNTTETAATEHGNLKANGNKE